MTNKIKWNLFLLNLVRKDGATSIYKNVYGFMEHPVHGVPDNVKSSMLEITNFFLEILLFADLNSRLKEEYSGITTKLRY
jgi:hypothetical protein